MLIFVLQPISLALLSVSTAEHWQSVNSRHLRSILRCSHLLCCHYLVYSHRNIRREGWNYYLHTTVHEPSYLCLQGILCPEKFLLSRKENGLVNKRWVNFTKKFIIYCYICYIQSLIYLYINFCFYLVI